MKSLVVILLGIAFIAMAAGLLSYLFGGVRYDI